MADIFLSYAAEDRPRIESLARALEAADLTVWWDRRIGTGSSFDVVIERELDSAGCVVVVWSKHSIGSEWVRNEATEGAERGVLVPLQIDAVRPPLAFRRRQTARLDDWPNGAHAESLREVVAAIRHIVASAPGAQSQHPDPPANAQRPPIVVAVLPLQDRTAERSMGYLCEGLAEDLMNALFPIDGLRVLSSTDTFALKDSTTSTREIATSLGATVVLEGSVQRAGERIAVSVRLVNVDDGVTIYSERFQRDANDVFEVQAQIAASVVEGLRATWGLAAMAAPLADARPRDPDAFVLYKSIQDPADLASSVVRGSPVNLRLLVALECAIALDPSLDRAYAELVRLYSSAGVAKGGYAKAKSVREQLNSRRPHSPLLWEIDAHLEADMTALASRCHTMITHNEGMYVYTHPTGLQDVRGAYGRALAHAGLHREAFEYLCLVDRPNEPNLHWNLLHACGCLVACREFGRAVALSRRIRGLSPDAHIVAPTFELVARIAAGDDLDAVLSVHQDEDIWHEGFRLPLLRAKQSGTRIEDAPPGVTSHYKEMRAHALLANDDVERGMAHLLEAIEGAGWERQWIAFRLPIFAVLFSDRVKNHTQYRKALTLAGLDDAVREPIRAQAASLTPITGVEVGPLLAL